MTSTFYLRLQALMKKKGLNNKELASIIGTSPQVISQYLNSNPDRRTEMKNDKKELILNKFTDISRGWFLYGEDEEYDEEGKVIVKLKERNRKAITDDFLSRTLSKYQESIEKVNQLQEEKITDLKKEVQRLMDEVSQLEDELAKYKGDH